MIKRDYTKDIKMVEKILATTTKKPAREMLLNLIEKFKQNHVMPKLTELKTDLAQLKKSLAAAEKTNDAKAKVVFTNTIANVEKQIAALEEKAPAKAEPKAKGKKVKEPKAKAEKVEKVATKDKKPLKEIDCKELKRRYDERRAKAKANAGKKTKPVLQRATEKVEQVIVSAIKYNKDKGTLNIAKMKQAVSSFADALTEIKDALTGKFEQTFITNFQKDMLKILETLEKEKTTAKERAKARKSK